MKREKLVDVLKQAARGFNQRTDYRTVYLPALIDKGYLLFSGFQKLKSGDYRERYKLTAKGEQAIKEFEQGAKEK